MLRAIVLSAIVAAAFAITYTPLSAIPAPTFGSTRGAGFKVTIAQNFQSGDTLSISGLPANWNSFFDAATRTLTVVPFFGGDVVSNLVAQVRNVVLTVSAASPPRTISWEVLTFCSSASSYTYYGSLVSSNQATANCAVVPAVGALGYLASITSASENSAVRALPAAAGQHLHISTRDDIIEGQWRLRTGPEGLQNSGTGILAPYLPWNAGEPNNSGNEDCVHLHPSGVWNDIACSTYNQPYVCEFTATAYLHSGVVYGQTAPISNLYQVASGGACGSAPPATSITYCCPEVTAQCTATQNTCTALVALQAQAASICTAEPSLCSIAAALSGAVSSCNRMYNACHALNIIC